DLLSDAGFDPQEIQQISIPLSEASNLAWVHTNKRPLCINDTHTDANFQFRESTTEDYVKSLLNAPLIVDGEVIGIMNLDSNEVNRFTQEDEDHLMAFTNQLAIAIQQARFIEQLQDNADKLEQRVQERTAELHLVNDDLRQQIIQRKLAETEREREQALLRTLIDNLPDNIYVKDTEQRYLVANSAIMTTLLNSKTHDEIVGKTNRQLFGDLDWVAEKAIQDAQLLESGEAIVEQEYKTQHPTNPADWYLITKIPLRDNKGKIIGFVGINRDISQLKRIQLQLAEERNLLRTVIDTIPDNIYVKDTEQRFMMVNRTLHQFLFQDYDMQEIIGKSNRDLFGDDTWVSEREQADNHLLTSGTPIYEQEYQIPETNIGIERGWFLLTKVP
ncbi:MAG: PAS domain-containing protein, partial [Chloroflexota bacterium]